MMRLVVFTAMGWALTVTGNGTRQATTDVVPPDAPAASTTIEVAQLDPGAQASDEGTAEPAAAEADESRTRPNSKPPRPKRSQKPGWLDDIPNRKPQTSIIKRLLHLVETAGEIDPDGKMHKKLSDDEKKKVRNTLLEIDADMQRLIQGDPSIAERDPNKKVFYSEEEERDELRKRTMARPKPEPALARTPGVVLKSKDERIYEARDGKVLEGGRALNTGTRSRHGTVIHRSKFSRGGGGGSARSPRVIVIPPSRRPAPPPAEPAPAEPEPAEPEPAEPEPAEPEPAEPEPADAGS